jgi:Holliday junction resolvase
MNSRRKGKVGEREAAKAVKEHLGWEAFRSAQACGKHAADLLGVPEGVHVEVKFVARLGVMKFMEQALRDRKPEQVPVVVMRENHGEWLAMVQLKDLKILSEIITERTKHE